MYTIDFSHPIHVYFVGIGGISMSALAEILVSAGFQVSGSDRGESDITKGLESKGIKVFYGQQKENITSDIDVAVFTAAIRPDNPEYIAVKELNIPTLTRAELLGQLMTNYKHSIAISGTHGKTTTTSMISEIFLGTDTDPTLLEGGILKSIGGNVRVGKHEIFVTEACEYTNSFLSFFPTVGVILNIEEDHLDFFKDLADIRRSFRRFAELLPENGTLVINGAIDNLSEITDGLKCRVVTFGSAKETANGAVDYFPSDIRYDAFGHPSFVCHSPEGEKSITLKVPGNHNVLNALAAIAVADIFHIAASVISEALMRCTGADRRFEYKGRFNDATLIDDYAHHPSEIRATLTAAKNYPHKTLWVVFQSHTFTRTKAFLKEFAEVLCLADRVVLADIYPARETDNLGISAETLQQEILSLGHPCDYFDSFEKIENFLLANCTRDDLVITMGAGDVYKIGDSLING